MGLIDYSKFYCALDFYSVKHCVNTKVYFRYIFLIHLTLSQSKRLQACKTAHAERKNCLIWQKNFKGLMKIELASMGFETTQVYFVKIL